MKTPPLTPEESVRVFDLVSEAGALEPTQQAAFLARACVGADRVRAEVESLLGFERRFPLFLKNPAFDQGLELLGVNAGDDLKPGDTVGDYRIVRLLGVGGMSEVYLADDRVHGRQIALKLVGPGRAEETRGRYFRHERRVLATLNHPHIARLYGSGTTSSGRAYLVMEYVEGERLDQYCDRRGLPIAERLVLFRQICAAAAYAHQNLVVHRDLKPANIRVTPEGEPKLLDFGIAKLLDPEGTVARIDPTLTMQGAMTPEYASPEQIKGEPITTASDVYSLGVVLYELLTGRRPYAHLKGCRPDELARAICEQEPPPPSTVVERTAPTTAPAVGVPPTRWRRQLTGDLDNIVGKALRKEPGRRYPSVAAFSEDVRRHCEGLPVTARPDTLLYRTSRFVRRHKAGVASGALVFIALMATSIVAAWQARRAIYHAAQSERRFNDVRALAHSFLFEFHDAIRDLPGSTPARRLLVTRALEYLDGLARESGGDNALRRELAQAYIQVGDVQGKPNSANLGDTTGALASYRRAAEIVETFPDDDASDAVRADAWNALGSLLADSGRDLPGALNLEKRTLALREKLAARAPADPVRQRDLVASLIAVGDAVSSNNVAVWDRTEEIRRAEGYFRRALDLCEQLRAGNPADLDTAHQMARLHYRLGNIYHQLGMHGSGDPALLARGLEHHRRSVALCEQEYAANPASAGARRNLADSLIMKSGVQTLVGDPAGALADCRRAITLLADLSAADPANYWARQDLAFAYYCASVPEHALSDLAGALVDLDRAESLYRSLADADPSSLTPVAHLNHILRLRTEICEERHDHAGAAESARRWVLCVERLSATSPDDESLRAELARARTAAGMDRL